VVGQVLGVGEALPAELARPQGMRGRARDHPEHRGDAGAQQLVAVAVEQQPVQRVGHGRDEAQGLGAAGVGRHEGALQRQRVLLHLGPVAAEPPGGRDHGAGIEFLLNEARDSQGREFSGPVSALAARGVDFRVCNNTLVSRGIDSGRLLMEAELVPSGVAEVARLQAREGFVCLKP
jgi:intracellular sulfur oxidation DsrE/DsrF family protein